jgi:hypothetical protein
MVAQHQSIPVSGETETENLKKIRILKMGGSEPLSKREKGVLNAAEGLIAKHLATFFEVGAALLGIREQRLYREEFSSFEEYCRIRWRLNRSHAYRMLDAAEVKMHLSPIGDIPLPENECQIRPLSGLPAKTAKKAWRIAFERAGDKQPTGDQVRKIVIEITKGAETKRHETAPESWQFLVEPLLTEAINQLKSGKRDRVEELLNKALLRLEIGRPHEDI